MTRGRFALGLGCLLAGTVCGCASSYAWKPSVPQEVRRVTVSTFRNESDVSEAGAVATRQLLREIQREGTFRLCASDEAALDIQGVVKSVSAAMLAYDRRTGASAAAYECRARVEVSVVDRRTRRVVISSRPYEASVGFTAREDLTTAMRDVTGRVMDDLSRRIVDDMLSTKW